MHFRIADGNLIAAHGPSEQPSATIKFTDLDTALAVFSRKLDPQAAFMQGKVQMAGDMADAMKISLITQMAMTYFV
jgi:putative sterol carrier protein